MSDKGRKNDRRRDKKTPKEFEERLLEIRKVTRVTTGGRSMSFRATILLGNRKGKVAIGTAKGLDVSIAVQKATREAYKNIVEVPVTEGATVPYALEVKNKASKIRLIPAAQGTGLKAGSSLRSVLELAGYENVLSKIIGSNNKLNVALTTVKALQEYKHAESFTKKSSKKDDKKVNESKDVKEAKKTDDTKKVASK